MLELKFGNLITLSSCGLCRSKLLFSLDLNWLNFSCQGPSILDFLDFLDLGDVFI